VAVVAAVSAVIMLRRRGRNQKTLSKLSVDHTTSKAHSDLPEGHRKTLFHDSLVR